MQWLGDRIRVDQTDWDHLSQQYTNNADFIKEENGAGFMRDIDPFRFKGFLSPGYTPADVASVSSVTSMCRNGQVVNGSTPYAYIVTEGDQLHQLDLSTYTISSAGSWPQAISTTYGAGHAGHTSVAGRESVLYRHNVGGSSVLSWFYSWIDNTDGDIGTYGIVSTTFNSDWLSTVPSSGGVLSNSYPCPLIVGADDILYYPQGNVLKGYDGSNGANGTVFTALTLPAGLIINGFSKTKDYLVIYTYQGDGVNSSDYYSGEVTAWFWDYLSLDPTYYYPIDDNYVSAGFTWGTTIGCFTSGRQGIPTSQASSKLRIFNGDKFETVANFRGNPPINGGVTVFNNMIHWLASTSGSESPIYSYGSPYGPSSALNQRFRPSGTGLGMLKSFTTDRIAASAGTTTSGGLQTLSTNFASASFMQTGNLAPLENKFSRWKLTKVRVAFATSATGGRSVTLSVVPDGNTLQTITTAISTVTAGTLIQDFGRIDQSGNALPIFSRLRLNAVYGSGSGATDCPVIDYIDLFVEGREITSPVTP